VTINFVPKTNRSMKIIIISLSFIGLHHLVYGSPSAILLVFKIICVETSRMKTI
jgi:hypothetical protein